MKYSLKGRKTVNNQSIIFGGSSYFPNFLLKFLIFGRVAQSVSGLKNDECRAGVFNRVPTLCKQLLSHLLTDIVQIPVKIRVRIDHPHLLVCRKRRLNGAVLRMRPEKPRPGITAGAAR